MSQTRRTLLAVILVCAGIVWLRINEKIEGRILLTLSRDHGVTTADLLSLAAFVAAVVIAWPQRPRR